VNARLAARALNKVAFATSLGESNTHQRRAFVTKKPRLLDWAIIPGSDEVGPAELFYLSLAIVPESVRTFEVMKKIVKAGRTKWKHSGGSEQMLGQSTKT
jgi:hypothetical protein